MTTEGNTKSIHVCSCSLDYKGRWQYAHIHVYYVACVLRTGFFLVVFAANEVSGLSDFLSFLKNFAWVFQKSLSFSEKMRVFRGKCEFFEENACFFTLFGSNFPISWVFCLSFCKKFLEFEFFSPWVFFKTTKKKPWVKDSCMLETNQSYANGRQPVLDFGKGTSAHWQPQC